MGEDELKKMQDLWRLAVKSETGMKAYIHNKMAKYRMLRSAKMNSELE